MYYDECARLLNNAPLNQACILLSCCDMPQEALGLLCSPGHALYLNE